MLKEVKTIRKSKVVAHKRFGKTACVNKTKRNTVGGGNQRYCVVLKKPDNRRHQFNEEGGKKQNKLEAQR